MTETRPSKTKLWVSAVLIILVIGALTAFAFTSLERRPERFRATGYEIYRRRDGNPDQSGRSCRYQSGDESSPQYIAVVRHLRNMRSLDDHIINAYILRVNPDQTATFLVDDLMIDDPAGSAMIGEVSTSPDRLEIFTALSAPTASKEPYTTKYGSFMSAYAPIDDNTEGSTGNTYAVLAIDMSANDYNEATSKGGLILATGILSMLIALGILFTFQNEKQSGKSITTIREIPVISIFFHR